MFNVLYFAQIPPPYHGQAIMLEKLLLAKYDKLKLIHVRLNYSKTLNEIGKFHFLKTLKLLKIISRGLLIIIFNKIDFIYYPPAGDSIHGVYRDLITLIVIRLFKRKLIFHFHPRGLNKIYNDFGVVMKFFFKLAYFKPDLAIVLSERNIKEIEFLKPQKIEVIQNGIEDHYNDYAFSLDRDQNKRPIILFVGNLIETKGVLILMNVLRNLQLHGEIFEAHFIGGFNDDATKEKVYKHEFYNYVIFHGIMTGEKKWELYAKASIFCFPTFYENENVPVVILEAMQFGLPIVTTNWASIPDLVTHGYNGYLAEPRNSNELENCIKKLLSNRDLRKNMGEKSRIQYLSSFTDEMYKNKFEMTLLTTLKY